MPLNNIHEELDYDHTRTRAHTHPTFSSKCRNQSTSRYLASVSLRNLLRSLSCNYQFRIHRADGFPESKSNDSGISAGGGRGLRG